MKAAISPEQKVLDRKNKYLLKKFNITLDQKEAMRREQNNLCLICGKPLDIYGPCNVDHYHFRLKAVKLAPKTWMAFVYGETGVGKFAESGETKKEAIAAVKAKALPWAVRGLLCAKCNKGLGYIEHFFDAASHPENLDAVKAYFIRRLEKILSAS